MTGPDLLPPAGVLRDMAVGAGIAFSGIMFGIRQLKLIQHEGRTGGGGGDGARVTETMVASLEKNIQAQTTVLQATSTMLIQVIEQMKNLPTKMDLAEEARLTRHDVRGYITPLAVQVEEILEAVVEKRRRPR